MKKALAGPAKPAARKKPKRRGIVATAGPRIRAVAAAVAKWERDTERKIERRARPTLSRWGQRALAVARRWSKRLATIARRVGKEAGKRLRPVGARLFRALAAIDAWLRRTAARCTAAATRASGVITPERAICAVAIAAATCLIVSQFVDYRGVRVGQPGYEGLTGVAEAPTVAVRTAGSAHSYLLIPLAVAAAFISVLALHPGRRRLGRVVFGLGLVAIAVVLLIDLPAGLDAGSQSARFAGATAVLDDGFYAELAASAVIAFSGLMLTRDPQRRARKSRLGRAGGGRRSARAMPARKPDSRPRTTPDQGLQRSAAIVPRRA